MTAVSIVSGRLLRDLIQLLDFTFTLTFEQVYTASTVKWRAARLWITVETSVGGLWLVPS